MTQHTQPSSEFIIFVTHVESDNLYLKIWGQLDKQAATTVEQYIYPLVEQFNQGYGCPSKTNRVIIGALCCARFQAEGYYRAKILSVRPDGMIVVQFIDYGNMEVLPPNEIHLLDNIHGSEPLRAYPAMAAEFTLVNVLPINSIWENRIIEAIKKSLCYNEYRALIQMVNNRCLIKLWYNNEDFSELLVKERMALPATIQDMFRPKHMLQPQMPAYEQQIKGSMNNFTTMPIMQNPNINHNTNMQGLFHKTFPPDVNQHKAAQPSPLPPPVQEALVFKSRVLDIGSDHEVFVSHVEDGPQKFSVQVNSTTAILTHLMNEINSRPKQPLQEPPLPGSVCLGRYRDAGDAVLCRAVVMSVMEHKCKLYYVDFGHTEILPYTDIFQLSPEYINPKVLSIRFTLSGLKELNITQELKQYFKDLVYRRLLILHVRPPEGPPLIQYGDLYDNDGINIKDMLKKAFPPPAAAVPITYSYPQLQRLSKDVQEIVHVSYVESCKKFFVQLDNGVKSLESIMAGLAQYAKTASVLTIAQLKAGLPCAALYDSQWYRAQILGIIGDKVKVVYVDYGNEEILPVMSLRAIHDDLVTKLPAQAVKCALNGYEVLSADQEVYNHFERLTLEKRFYMKVVAAQPNGLLVDLFEFDTMRSIHPQLLNNLFCDKTENSAGSSRSEEIQHSLKTMNNFESEEKDKNDKKNHIDSWNRNQNSKSFQDNKSNTWKDEWSQEKQYDNRREKTGNYSHRDNSQNNRFIKDEATNNRFGRDRSYNKYDKSEVNTFNKGDRGTPRGGGNRIERRYNRNNSTEKICSDKDSDTSSRSGGKRGKGSFNGGRRGGRDGGTSGKWQTATWNDKKPAMAHRSSYKNGDYNTNNNKFRNREDNTSNDDTYDQINASESWGTDDANKELQNNVTANIKSQLSSMDITLGSVKNCEVVFINDPSNFFIQLSPDCLELDTIMESIAATYENGGEMMQAFEVQCGTCCIAQYSDDLKWYRAIIKSIEGSNATVEFVDYGNTESVDFTKIKIIQEEFLKLPMQAVHCKLFGLTDTGNKESENTIFLEKVEAKPLQVEFVAEENRVYKVLLREVIDDVPNTNYINEEFCAIADLMKAKETTASNKASKMTTKKRQKEVTPDYAPFDSKWQTTLYEPESRHDVIVTWFINPNKLYCQILTKEAEFKTMMSEIQKTYANREPIIHKLQIGSAIIAIFSEDRALYRAEIVSIDAQRDAYVVQYIDFGNCATVTQRNIYSVEKKFMELPRLAVQCSLRNIIPNNDSNWSKVDNDALDNCFNADKYECTFHSFSDDQYTISLSHNGQDVGDTLIQKNLAAWDTKTLNETVDEAPATEVKAFSDIERVDISLLTGQTLRMRVSDVESTTLFHVQLPSASKCENIVDRYMADKDTKVMPRLSTREMCLGAGCLVNAYGTWRRAVVINCSRSIGFDIKLIDTGTYDEILDGALALPGELAVMQNQALECSLRDVSASSDADKQLKELEGKEVLVYVEEVNNSRLIVRLYDLLGNGIINTEEKEGKISPVCPMPILSSTHKVCASYADHSASIWLQRYSDVEIETKLLEDLEQYYTNSGQRLKPQVHLLCAAKCSDGRWYRGKIVSHTETMACVNYIDYGNTEEVALESIMILEPQFYEPHQLAVNVSLSVILTGTETEQINILETHVMNKDFTAVFYNVHNKWIVDLIENEEKLSDRFRSLNLVKEEEPITKLSSQTHEESTINKFEVSVSHVDSPSQFWLQQVDEITLLNEKQEQLQLEVSDFPAMSGIPEEGTLCVAVYSIDSRWYRAEVLDADEDITTVRFIDYGNTDVIDNKIDNIRQISDAWKNLKRFAIKCRLDVIPVGTEDWNESTCERFENLVTSAEILQALIVTDATPKRVELFINDKSVSETLVEEKHAIIINTEQEPVDEIVDLELDPHSAFVCHVNSPSEFWVQEEKSVADLEVMADRFMIADMFPRIDDVKEGLLCVAKYPEDEQWYRARVVSHDDNGTQVIYIDYGNSAVSIEIRAIPEDLAGIPPLSRKCCLELPPQVKEWSEQAREEFVRLAADGATIFLLDVLKEQDTSLVKLTLDDQNVTDILASMCEQHLPVIEERLPPLGEENSPNVVVSHVNSPNEFWIQAESSISELEVMSDRLRDAESFVTLNNLDVDTVCAARYPEDGYWYRAKIVAHCEEGTEVLYMDYGNSAVTEELKVLPEDIVNIPTLSKRCALEKPSHIVAWSDKACDKFKELVAEGATMFQFETLDEKNPMHVRLSLNGTNVIDLLLSEYENIPEVEEIKDTDITSNIEEQQEAIIHEDHQLVNGGEEISNLNKEAESEPTFNQTDNLDSNNLDSVDQLETFENVIEEICSKSFKDLDINEKHEKHEKHDSEEQEKDIAKISEIKEDMTENPEIAIIKCTEMKEISEDINTVETNEDLDQAIKNKDLDQAVKNGDLDQAIKNEDLDQAVKNEDLDQAVKNEMISITPVTPITSYLKESSLVITELSVDEIIGNMIRDTIEDVESRRAGTNLLIHETQLQDVIQSHVTDEQELFPKVQSIDTNKSLETQILETVEAIEDTENLDSKKILSNKSQSQDVARLSISQIKNEEEIESKVESDVNEPSEILYVMPCSSREQINLEHIRRRSLTKDEIISGDMDTNVLKSQSESTETDKDSSVSSGGSTCTVKAADSSPAVIKTDFAEQYNYSRRRSEDKIVPGCISRGESPVPETKRPVTPKTSHSEKLVAGVVNPIVETDSTNGDDETLTVSLEDNIPKFIA